MAITDFSTKMPLVPGEGYGATLTSSGLDLRPIIYEAMFKGMLASDPEDIFEGNNTKL